MRLYKADDLIWDAKEGCQHEWGNELRRNAGTLGNNLDTLVGTQTAGKAKEANTQGQFCSLCGAWRGQLGLEPSPDSYIKHLCDIFDLLKPRLKKTGTLWINIGDSYAGGGNNHGNGKALSAKQNSNHGADLENGLGYPMPSDCLPKSLIGIPERFVLEMMKRGWIRRNTIIWHKPNPMPESVTDRFTDDFEYIYVFVQSSKYYFERQFEPNSEVSIERAKYGLHWDPDSAWTPQMPNGTDKMGDRFVNPLGRNKRSVWTIPTQGLNTVHLKGHYACVSEDTECLTYHGWKHYSEIKRGDLIAAYDRDSKTIKFTPCSYLSVYKINDVILKLSGSRNLEMLLTENHRVVAINRNGREKIVEAKDLAGKDRILVSAPLEVKAGDSIGEDTAELLGWIISEGCYQADGGIYIYQNEGKYADRIRRLLKPYAFTEKTRKGNQVEWYLRVKSASMFKALMPEKRLYEWMVYLPLNEAQWLFNALVDGDGSRRTDGRITFIQKDKTTADWFSILAMRLGWYPTTSDLGTIYHTHLTKRRTIGIRSSKSKKIQMIPYRGIVWCPTTAFGTWVARRSGRVFITGNSYPEKLCETPIKAGCPLYICSKCGKPRVKVYKETGKMIKFGGYGSATAIEQGVSPTSSLLTKEVREIKELGYSDCGCHAPFVSGIVLDPFAGTGTTLSVAKRLGRKAVGIELSRKYCQLAVKRIENTQPPLEER